MWLEEIIKKIQKYEDELEVISDVSKKISPATELVVDAVKGVCKSADKFKLNCMLKGLADGRNEEKNKNELYNYVSNSGRAFFLADCFRKMILADSPITCCIMGIILSDTVCKHKPFTYIDGVLYKAIQNFTDFDIHYFKEIMEGNFRDDKYPTFFDVKKFPDDKKPAYTMTISLCKQNRIFEVITGDYDGFAFFGEMIGVTEVSEKLLGYINRARRILEYDKKWLL